jgi:opacity protein-like surface antigen
MKMLKGLLALILLVIVPAAFADMGEDIQKLVGDNAVKYVHPLTNGIGVAMNSGWYNSSKSYSFLKLPAGLQIYFGEGISIVDDKLKTYTFKGAVASSNLGLPAVPGLPDTLRITVPGAPTAVGPKQGNTFTLWQLLGQNGVDTSLALLQAMPATQKNQVVLAMPGGQNLSALPGIPPVIGLNIGLPFKAQIGLRFLPPFKVPNFGSISQFGMKGQYEFTQFIPVVASLPLLHTSAMFAFNNINLFDIMKLNNWTAMVNASADFKFLVGLGLYGGIGMEGSTMTLDYKVPETVVGLGGTKVSLEDKGDNGFKALVGVRFSFLVFDLYSDATFAATRSYHIGLALGFNGL